MECASITSDKEKKKQVLKYVDIHTELMWKIFPEFSDDNKTYKEFKEAILDQYPDTTGDYIYSI